MDKFTNSLDKIRIASPCSADWNEMRGDARKRFCADCKLNVYNLSAMTRKEAENLLINSEGRLCVRFYRRSDGTILTQNCPIGWAKVKQRVSRIATATFSMIAGFLVGTFPFYLSKSFKFPVIDIQKFKPKIDFERNSPAEEPKKGPSFGGMISNLNNLNEEIRSNQKSKRV